MAISSEDTRQDFYIFYGIFPAIVVFLALFDLLVLNSIVWPLVTLCFYGCSVFYAQRLAKAVLASFYPPTVTPKNQSKGPCGVCSNDTCKRHTPLPHSTRVKVPGDFDRALEQLLEQLLQTHVCAWYSNFSSNQSFVQQLRLATATAVRGLTTRVLRADVSTIIFERLIPLVLQHARDWQELAKLAPETKSKPEAKTDDAQTKEPPKSKDGNGQGGRQEDRIIEIRRIESRIKEYGGVDIEAKAQKAKEWRETKARKAETKKWRQLTRNAAMKKSKEWETQVIKYFGHDLHPAARSRKAELDYLRGIATALVPQLLPTVHVSTSNKVILREILANWILLPAMDALADPENINALITLCTRRDTTLSNQPDAINVPMLQCWLSMVPKINQNNLKPTLDEVLSDPLLFFMFMRHVKETGPMNLLQFCLDIDDLSKRMLIPEMKPDVEEELLVDVQNMYSTFLDPDSPEYLHLPRHISTGIKQILDGGTKKIQELRTSRPFYQAHQEAYALLEATCLISFHHSYQLYNLLCGQLTQEQAKQSPRANVIGPTSAPKETASKTDGTFQLENMYHVEDIDYHNRSEIKYDLSTWRVSVPHVDSNGNQPLYMIAIHSVWDARSWTVLRRDQDFYTLRTRLIEFHGEKELNDSPLPSRKNHLSYTINKQRYEDFLQKLLAKPVLKNSELLYTFLSSQNLKPYLANYSIPDIGILYQSVAYVLRKEKGQHLDKFMATFLASTHTKFEHTDVGIDIVETKDLDRKGPELLHGIFGNNLNWEENTAQEWSKGPIKQHVKGACSCIADAVTTLLRTPAPLSRFFWMLTIALRAVLDPLVNNALYKALVRLLSGGRAATVVKLLHSKILNTREINLARREWGSQSTHRDWHSAAREGMRALLPHWLRDLGDSLVEPLQHAPLNKHLAYTLLDQVLVSLFPEIPSQ